ncbi:hypothetical protein CSUI_004559 [Cystoisospora suis]|uniref:Uncharacterized protein n=1 Tax=Cystoisospora suis TaxID=483139 RepID=A0A2C6L0G0_9APIC|nr:hypothetical protein CSUI_004559 [Cystoisospora suis]
MEVSKENGDLIDRTLAASRSARRKKPRRVVARQWFQMAAMFGHVAVLMRDVGTWLFLFVCELTAEVGRAFCKLGSLIQGHFGTFLHPQKPLALDSVDQARPAGNRSRMRLKTSKLPKKLANYRQKLERPASPFKSEGSIELTSTAKQVQEIQFQHQLASTQLQQCPPIQQALPTAFSPNKSANRGERDGGDAVDQPEKKKSTGSPGNQGPPSATQAEVARTEQPTVREHLPASHPPARNQSDPANRVSSRTVEQLLPDVETPARYHSDTDHGFTIVSRGKTRSSGKTRTTALSGPRPLPPREELPRAGLQGGVENGKAVHPEHGPTRHGEGAIVSAKSRLANALRNTASGWQNSGNGSKARLSRRPGLAARQLEHAAHVSSSDTGPRTSNVAREREASPEGTVTPRESMPNERELGRPKSGPVPPRARTSRYSRSRTEAYSVQKLPKDVARLSGSAGNEAESSLTSAQATTQASETVTEPNNSVTDTREPALPTSAPPKRWIDHVSDEDDEGCLSAQEPTGRVALLGDNMDLPVPKEVVGLDSQEGHPPSPAKESSDSAVEPRTDTGQLVRRKEDTQAEQSVIKGPSAASSVSSEGVPGRARRQWYSNQADDSVDSAAASCWPSLGAAAAEARRKKDAGPKQDHRHQPSRLSYLFEPVGSQRPPTTSLLGLPGEGFKAVARHGDSKQMQHHTHNTERLEAAASHSRRQTGDRDHRHPDYIWRVKGEVHRGESGDTQAASSGQEPAGVSEPLLLHRAVSSEGYISQHARPKPPGQREQRRLETDPSSFRSVHQRFPHGSTPRQRGSHFNSLRMGHSTSARVPVPPRVPPRRSHGVPPPPPPPPEGDLTFFAPPGSYASTLCYSETMAQAAAEGLDPAAACQRLALQQQPLLSHLRPLTASHSFPQMPFLADPAYYSFPDASVPDAWIPGVPALFLPPPQQPADEQLCTEVSADQVAAPETATAEGTAGQENEAGSEEQPLADAPGPQGAAEAGPDLAAEETGTSCLPSESPKTHSSIKNDLKDEKPLTPSPENLAGRDPAPHLSLEKSSALTEGDAVSQCGQVGLASANQLCERTNNRKLDADGTAAVSSEECPERDSSLDSQGAVSQTPATSQLLQGAESAEPTVQGVGDLTSAEGHEPEAAVEEKLGLSRIPTGSFSSPEDSGTPDHQEEGFGSDDLVDNYPDDAGARASAGHPGEDSLGTPRTVSKLKTVYRPKIEEPALTTDETKDEQAKLYHFYDPASCTWIEIVGSSRIPA